MNYYVPGHNRIRISTTPITGTFKSSLKVMFLDSFLENAILNQIICNKTYFPYANCYKELSTYGMFMAPKTFQILYNNFHSSIQFSVHLFQFKAASPDSSVIHIFHRRVHSHTYTSHTNTETWTTQMCSKIMCTSRMWEEI